jgi:hypothetical protein
MPTLIVAIVAFLGGVATYLSLYTPKGREAARWLKRNTIGSSSDVAAELARDLSPALNGILTTIIQTVEKVGPQLTSQIRPLLSALAEQQFTEVDGLLSGEGESTPDKAVGAAAVAIGNAFGQGAASAGVTALFESIFPEKLNTLNAAGPIFRQMAGFDEIAGAVRRPLYENAFGKSLEYHYRSIFRPELPDEFDAVLWHSRRLLSDDQLRNVFKYSGLKTEYEEPYIRSAYRSVQPRAIATMIQDTVFPYDAMKDLLEFAGLRDSDKFLMLDLLEQNSTKNLRGKYVDALLHAAERGTMTLADLDNHMTSLGFSALAQNYVHLTVSIRKLDQLLEIYRKQVSIAYETGQLSDADYVPTLEAAGIAAPDAEAHYGIDSTRLRGKVLLQQERAAAAGARRLQAVEVRNAEEQFMTGAIDEFALAAALTAAGVVPSLTVALTSLFIARKAGTRVYIFGKLVNRQDSALLREQVAAIEEQTIKKLIAPAAALQALANLGIPPANTEALVAKWAAQADKVILPI